MAGKIVEDDNIAGIERRRELGFDIGFEDRPVHRRIDDPWRGQPIMPQGCDEGLGSPMTEGCPCSQPLAALRPPAQPGHLRRRRGLVDKDQSMRLLAHPGLAAALPATAPLSNVSARGLVGQQRFF